MSFSYISDFGDIFDVLYIYPIIYPSYLPTYLPIYLTNDLSILSLLRCPPSPLYIYLCVTRPRRRCNLQSSVSFLFCSVPTSNALQLKLSTLFSLTFLPLLVFSILICFFFDPPLRCMGSDLWMVWDLVMKVCAGMLLFSWHWPVFWFWRWLALGRYLDSLGRYQTATDLASSQVPGKPRRSWDDHSWEHRFMLSFGYLWYK